MHNMISAAKNDGMSPEQFLDAASVPPQKKAADIYVEYQRRFKQAGAMDFDDLLLNTVQLFRGHPDVLDHYRRRFRHVMVDEYQDTNTVQNDLVVQLAGDHRQVTVVGDADQCLPAGTRIRVPAGSKPIEELSAGDEVLGAAGVQSSSSAESQTYERQPTADGSTRCRSEARRSRAPSITSCRADSYRSMIAGTST